MILQIIAAYFVTLMFSIMFHSAKHQLFSSGFVGALGWAAYLIGVEMGFTVVVSSFLGAFLVSVMSYVMSYYRKAPITVFQIPGIIPLVPGMGMYKTLRSAMNGPDGDVFVNLFETLQIAGAIAIAMLLVHSLRHLMTRKKITLP